MQVLTLRGALGAALGPLALAGMLPSAWAATPWPEVPTLPRTHYELVAPEMRVNGVPTHIEVFDSELSEREVIEYFRAHWAMAPAGPPKDLSVPGWSAISTVHGPFQIAAQVRPKATTGSQGRVSISNFGEIQRNWIPPELPRYPDTQVLQMTETRDGPRWSRLVTMLSRQAVEINVERWRSEWQRRGYAVAQQSTGQAPGASPWIATLVKGSASVDLVINRVPNTQVTQITANLLSEGEAMP